MQTKKFWTLLCNGHLKLILNVPLHSAIYFTHLTYVKRNLAKKRTPCLSCVILTVIYKYLLHFRLRRRIFFL